MGRRVLLVTSLALGIAGALASIAESGPPPLAEGRTIYVVQPDPRLCPSPRCGGYWVSRANYQQTRCHDHVVRPRCYVATAVDQRSGRTLGGIAAGALVRAALGSSNTGGFGELGVLIIAEHWAPATSGPSSGTYYRVRDLGVRCIRAPCFSMRAWRVNGAFRVTISGLDFGPPGAGEEVRQRATAALTSPGGLLVRGRLRGEDGGLVLRATSVYLEEPLPRA